MQIPSAFSAGVQGLQSAQSGLTQATVDIARPAPAQQADSARLVEEADKTSALVSALESKAQGQASVEVIERASDTLGSIIDIEV
ncbi:chemotaxis protein [Shewanella algae]|uniref:chemotaxis protein n=1 Tax=Shewanella algae TaxID=38313 RepID=UPI000D14EFC0|nr:chemotaxis protein [Shewanella algae]MBO2670792.1 chemotaxis protein [Shewanella algae]PST68231.1 chemotaxis protein [Shewanella algae]